jgi:hypothetical protein
MKHKLKQKLEKYFLQYLFLLKLYYKIPSFILIINLLKKQRLMFRIINVKVASRIYTLPTILSYYNRYLMSLRLLIKLLRPNFTKNFFYNISLLLLTESSNKNINIEKIRNNIYKTIASYRGYLHYRWRK